MQLYLPNSSHNGFQNPKVSASLTEKNATNSNHSLPPIRACIFDMDGLLINTEDLYFTCMDNILAKYNKLPVPWSLRPRPMGVPSAIADSELYSWADLPITEKEFQEECRIQRSKHYPECEILPGVERLLADLKNARGQDGKQIEIAMASSSTTHLYNLKVSRPEIGNIFRRCSPKIIGYWETILDWNLDEGSQRQISIYLPWMPSTGI
jgi:hypothetical protein